ncbi:MAG: sigma-E factor negative regulatory protein [Lysobacteraceae bacterium]
MTANQDNSHDIKEQLSALADGELDRNSARFLLRRCETDAALVGDWSRYHLIGACVRRSEFQLMPQGFADRVRQQLLDEAAPRRGGTLLRWGGGAAIAASVALVALMATRPVGIDQSSPAANASMESIAATTTAPVSAGAVVESPLRESDLRPDFGSLPAQTVSVTQGRTLGPARFADPRIESYLVRHNLALQSSGRAAPLDYVRVVASGDARSQSASETR